MGYFPGVGAFEQLFGPGREEFNTNFPKLQMPGRLPGWGGHHEQQFRICMQISCRSTVFCHIQHHLGSLNIRNIPSNTQEALKRLSKGTLWLSYFVLMLHACFQCGGN